MKAPPTRKEVLAPIFRCWAKAREQEARRAHADEHAEWSEALDEPADPPAPALRLTPDPDVVDTSITNWRSADNLLAQLEVAARAAPPLPEVGDETGALCPSCDTPLVVTACFPPDEIFSSCPVCGSHDSRNTL